MKYVSIYIISFPLVTPNCHNYSDVNIIDSNTVALNVVNSIVRKQVVCIDICCISSVYNVIVILLQFENTLPNLPETKHFAFQHIITIVAIS